MSKKKVIAPIIGVILVVIVVLIGSMTPLLGILNPATGVIQNSRNLVINNQTYSLSGLQKQVTVVQDSYGVYHFYASSSSDLYYALGFVQAKNRLFQIEIFGLEGMGQMETFLGSSYQNYDKFQTLTGAPVTAENDWNTIVNGSATNSTDQMTKLALLSYASGINSYINYSESHKTLPVMFKLLGVEPYSWNPVYSFAVQEIMAQQLEFGDSGLKLSTIYNLIGNATYNLIPTFSSVQSYYYAGYSGAANESVLAESHNTYAINSTVASMAKSLIYQFQYDPPTYFPTPVSDHSNEIVIAANRTTTGNPILMGGPVLGFSLPAIWFQVQLVAPGIDAYGVVLPGEPAIVIGFNNNIAWTLTDTQAISGGTFFFVQTVVDGKYLWNSSMHAVKTYSINGMTVNWTNLGPIMIQNGSNAIVMDWMGNRFSNDLGALLNIMVAANWTQFKAALYNWGAPYQNFAFANKTMIADISPAYYPIFGGTTYNPGAIMPGDGSEYIVGNIPYAKVPQVVNPPSGFIVSSNQRQVGPAYPYWFGNTLSFSPGYRAMMEVDYLLNHSKVSVQDVMSFQQENYTDYEAQMAVPHILSDLAGNSNQTVKQAVSLLSNWNYSMSTNSLAASVWFFTYMYLFNDTFLPYLNNIGWLPGYNNTLGTPSGISGSYPNTAGYASMDIDLLGMLINGSAKPYSSDNISTILGNAVIQAMSYLESNYPSGNFSWGHYYGFEFPNLYGLDQFSVGPIRKGGDYNTPNDASGVGPSNYPTGGQSWIMVANLANLSTSYGIYPGGQSENPASPLYSNYINDWIDGTYLPLLYLGSAGMFSNNQIMDELTLNAGGGS